MVNGPIKNKIINTLDKIINRLFKKEIITSISVTRGDYYGHVVLEL